MLYERRWLAEEGSCSLSGSTVLSVFHVGFQNAQPRIGAQDEGLGPCYDWHVEMVNSWHVWLESNDAGATAQSNDAGATARRNAGSGCYRSLQI